MALKIVINLPFPPSVNHIWKPGQRGRSYLAQGYQTWRIRAGQEWLTQKIKQPKAISGGYSAILILVKPSKHRRDLDNHIKAIKDFAVQHAIVQDDSLCEKLYVRWGTKQEAPLGAKLILKAIRGR